jgi:hypothetical protein
MSLIIFLLSTGRWAVETKLNPCDLPAALQTGDPEVTISGDLKEALQLSVCCNENSASTKICR